MRFFSLPFSQNQLQSYNSVCLSDNKENAVFFSWGVNKKNRWAEENVLEWSGGGMMYVYI
jgi:hypothetical protein